MFVVSTPLANPGDIQVRACTFSICNLQDWLSPLDFLYSHGHAKHLLKVSGCTEHFIQTDHVRSYCQYLAMTLGMNKLTHSQHSMLPSLPVDVLVRIIDADV